MSLRDDLFVAIRNRMPVSARVDVECLEAADTVLAVLREGPWFDEAVERMRHLWWTMNEDNSWPYTFEDGQAESVLDIEAAVRLLLLAALGEE